MKECPFSYSRAGYKNCQTSSCALWHSDSGKYSITAIANFLYSKKPSCSTCAHKKTKCNYVDNSYKVVCDCGHYLNNPGVPCNDYQKSAEWNFDDRT